jgi:GAF domain-containing protein
MPYVRCGSCGVRAYRVRGAPCPSCDADLLPDNVEQTMELAAAQLGMEASVLGEVTGGLEVVRRVAGEAEALGIDSGVSTPLSGTYCEQLLAGHLPNAVPDTAREPLLADLPGTVDYGIRAYIGVDFKLNARLYVLCCLSRERRPQLGEREVTFLRGIAESVRAQLEPHMSTMTSNPP